MANEQNLTWDYEATPEPQAKAQLSFEYDPAPAAKAKAPAAPQARPKKTQPKRVSSYEGRDLLKELETDVPGIGFTTAFRDRAYQEDMKRRGYKPSDNSNHLKGDSIDINSFPGMSLSQGSAMLRKKYPGAKILYGDKNHLDHVHVDFPGYGAFPAVGNAAKAGVSNDRGVAEWDYTNQEEDNTDQDFIVDEETGEKVSLIRFPVPKQEEPAPEGNYADSFSIGARGIVKGTGSLLDIVAGPLNGIINALPGEQGLSTTPFTDAGEAMSDYLGFAVPKSDAEKIAFAINEGGIQGLLTFGAGTAVAGAKGTTGLVGKAIASAPVTEITASAASTAAGEVADQQGLGPVGQIAASLVAGGITAATALKVEKAFRQKAADMPTYTAPEELKLQQALEDVKPRRAEQDKITSEVRKERLAKARKVQKGSSGESGYFKELAQLKGDIKKVDADSIRDQFTQKDMDSLFDTIKLSENLGGYESLNARTALAKVLGADGFTTPTLGEIKLLEKVFDSKTIQNLQKTRPLSDRIEEGVVNAINLPRSLMSTLDASAPFRQGLNFVGRKEFYKNFSTMFKAMGSEKGHRAVMEDINTRPSAELLKEAKVHFSELDGTIASREEDFMSNWAERIPLAGRAVRASNRGYVSFLNKLRADVFDDIVSKSPAGFIDDPKALKDLGTYINAATGRGPLGKYLEPAAPLLNSLFFSPRLISSRVTLLNPKTYLDPRISPVVRKEAVKDLLKLGSIATSVLTLAKMGGAEVETDPRSSNFAKIKTGDTRHDILGGYQQFIKLGAVLVSNQTKTGRGEIKELGKGFGADTRFDKVVGFGRNKASPIASYVMDYLAGENVIGEEFQAGPDAVKRFIPLFLQDVYEASEEEGTTGVLKTLPAAFGVGVSTYPTPVSTTGKTVNTNDEPTAVEKELKGLQERLYPEGDKKVIGVPNQGSLRNHFEAIGRGPATDEELEEYQKVSGKKVAAELEKEMADPT